MQKRQSRLLQIAFMLGLVVADAGALLANGAEFFPAGDGPVDLVYFGRIKNAQTGRQIAEFPYMTITDRLTGLYIPFTGDAPGHFRSPDIGALIKELTGETVDPRQLDITVNVPGYKSVKLGKAPRRAKGTIEINFKVEPENATAAASGAAGGSGSQTIWITALMGCVALVAIAAVARTLVRPASTSH